MSETVVIAIDLDKVKGLADHLKADLWRYEEGAFTKAFKSSKRIIAVMALGIVVRGIAPLIQDKWSDPAVVMVTPDIRFAVPVLGGHHGANELARELSTFGLIPIISTATEVAGLESVEGIMRKEDRDLINHDSTRVVNAAILKGSVPLYLVDDPGIVLAGPGVSILLRKGDYTVGIGCRRGTSKEDVQSAIKRGLNELNISVSEILAFATTDKKSQEAGLLDGISSLGCNLVFLGDEDINTQEAPTPSPAVVLGLNGVAEPAALAISRRKELVMRRKVFGNVTIAIAR